MWFSLFGHTHPKVLIVALQTVTRDMQFMPKPGHLSRAIEAAKAQLCWKEKGLLTATQGEDAKGVPCVFWSDQPTVPAYRAVDCKEGRAFLAKMAQTAGLTRDKMLAKWETWTRAAKDLGIS